MIHHCPPRKFLPRVYNLGIAFTYLIGAFGVSLCGPDSPGTSSVDSLALICLPNAEIKSICHVPSYLLAEFGAYSNQVSRLQPDVGCWEAWRLLFKLYNLGLHRAYAYIFGSRQLPV